MDAQYRLLTMPAVYVTSVTVTNANHTHVRNLDAIDLGALSNPGTVTEHVFIWAVGPQRVCISLLPLTELYTYLLNNSAQDRRSAMLQSETQTVMMMTTMMMTKLIQRISDQSQSPYVAGIKVSNKQDSLN